jgi:hypothetical protein
MSLQIGSNRSGSGVSGLQSRATAVCLFRRLSARWRRDGAVGTDPFDRTVSKGRPAPLSTETVATTSCLLLAIGTVTICQPLSRSVEDLGRRQ